MSLGSQLADQWSAFIDFVHTCFDSLGGANVNMGDDGCNWNGAWAFSDAGPTLITTITCPFGFTLPDQVFNWGFDPRSLSLADYEEARSLPAYWRGFMYRPSLDRGNARHGIALDTYNLSNIGHARWSLIDYLYSPPGPPAVPVWIDAAAVAASTYIELFTAVISFPVPTLPSATYDQTASDFKVLPITGTVWIDGVALAYLDMYTGVGVTKSHARTAGLTSYFFDPLYPGTGAGGIGPDESAALNALVVALTASATRSFTIRSHSASIYLISKGWPLAAAPASSDLDTLLGYIADCITAMSKRQYILPLKSGNVMLPSGVIT